MACTDLTKGRGLDCSRISGGVKYIYFGVLDQFTAPIETVGITQTAGEITDIEMGAGTGLYRYTMPLGVASITDTIVGSRENGTIYYTPTAQVLFNRITKEDQNQIKLLGATKVVIFAQLNQQLANGHDIIVGMGVVNGMELNAGTIDSGAAWGDKNGYTLTFDGMEALPMPLVADYTTNPFDNSAFTNVSITTS
jgi:hypothetical protein|tara:strand:+ start:339 stop:923 length:585 start_codon:yes stop_codon:yes gene_type:complete